MVFTRIATGATRSLRLARIAFATTWSKTQLFGTQQLRRLVTMPLLIASVVSFPIPVKATDTLVATPDDDPSLRTKQIIASLQTENGLIYSVTPATSVTLAVGESLDAATRRAEAERLASEAAAKRAATTKIGTAVVSTAPSNPTGTCGVQAFTAYDDLFQKYFGDEWKIARAVAMAESTMNPCAISRTNDHGLMQIHNGRVSFGEKIYNPEDNIRIAAQNYWAKRGWSPWSTWKKGLHLKFIK